MLPMLGQEEEGKKKCDSRKSGCGQCEKRGIDCPGYRDRFRFVLSKSQPNGKEPGHDRTWLETDASENLVPVNKPSSSIQVLPHSLHNTAHQIQLFLRYEDIYAPRSRNSTWPALSTNLSDLPSWEWILSSVSHAQTEPLLNDVVLALILGNLSRWETESTYHQLQDSGKKFHARALSQLKARLQDGRKCADESALAAVMVFGIYELQVGSEARAASWVAHVQGTKALLQARGSERKPSSVYAKQAFWASHYNAWVTSMNSRGSSQPRTPPNHVVDHDDEMPTDVHLFLILQRIGHLTAQVDQFRKIATSTSHSCCPDLRSKISTSLLHELNKLRSELAVFETESALCWTEPSYLYQTTSNMVSPTFASTLHFPSIRIAAQLLFTWTGQLSLALLSERLNTTSHSTPTLDPGKSTADTYASLIARSLEFFLHPDMGLMGTNIIGFPFSVVRRYYKSREMQAALVWFDVLEARMAEMKSGLGGFLRAVENTRQQGY